MKKLFAALGLLLLTACANYSKPASEPFEITSATFNEWAGGRAQTSGYKATLTYTAKDTVVFKNVFFRGLTGRANLLTEKGTKYIISYFNKPTPDDNLVMDADSKKELNNTLPQVRLPFKLKEHEMAVSYRVGNTTKYFVIKKITQTKSDYYPR